MTELREAVQELLDYYDRLAAKFGRVAEFKGIKAKVDNIKRLMSKDTDDLMDKAVLKAGIKQAEELSRAKQTIIEIDEALAGGADETIWPSGMTRGEAIKHLIEDYWRQHNLRQEYEAKLRELNERQERLEAENEKYKSSYETCDHERTVVHKDLGNTKKTILYLQVLLPQLKEQGDVTTVKWIEGALDEGEQPHESEASRERVSEINRLMEKANREDDDE